MYSSYGMSIGVRSCQESFDVSGYEEVGVGVVLEPLNHPQNLISNR